MKGVKGSQHHSSESKKAATPHKGAKGSQHHFRTEEGGNTNQHPPPTWREAKGAKTISGPKKAATPTLATAKQVSSLTKRPRSLCSTTWVSKGFAQAKKWTQSVSLSSIMSAKTVMESPDFICRRFGDGGRNHLEVAPVHLGFSAPIRSSASKLPPSPSALMASNTFVFGCLL